MVKTSEGFHKNCKFQAEPYSSWTFGMIIDDLTAAAEKTKIVH